VVLKYPLIAIQNLVKEDTQNSFFITPINSEQGSSTTAFYSIFKPGELSQKYRHNNCEVISVLLNGRGVFGIGNERMRVGPGDCGLVNRGSEHFFSTSPEHTSLMVGFFIGAKDITATGAEITGPVTQFDLKNTRQRISRKNGIIVNIDDTAPEKMDENDGWKISDFRLPLSARNGSSSTLFRARFMPGAIHKKHCHKNCDEIYYIISGHGLAGAGPDRVEVRGGHFHFIPKGVEHWLYNLSKTDPIEVVGIYCNAGSVAETGYAYMGDVSKNDLSQRTS